MGPWEPAAAGAQVSDGAVPIEEFIHAITTQLDRVQDALRLKAVNRPLTYALKDLSMELHVFVEVDAQGTVRFRTSAPNEAPIIEQLQPVLRHRGPEQVATELFQAHPICRRHIDIGVEIEARKVRVPRPCRQHPGRVGIGPHAPHTRPRAGPERDAPLD